MRIDVCEGAALECHFVCGGGLLSGSFCVPGVNRIDTVKQLAPAVEGAIPGIGKTDCMKGPQPHAARSAVAHVPEKPRLTTGLGDLEIETAAVCIQTRLGGLSHFQLAQLVERSRQDSDSQINYQMIAGL